MIEINLLHDLPTEYKPPRMTLSEYLEDFFVLNYILAAMLGNIVGYLIWRH